MAIRKGVKVFLGGCLQTVDLDEKGRVTGKKPAEDAVADGAAKKKDVDPNKPPTKLELMKTLKAMGVSFNATLGNVKLQALIDANKKPAEGAVAGEAGAGNDSGRGDKETGTGNQEVI